MTCETMILSNHLCIHSLLICRFLSTQISLDSVPNYMVLIIPPHLYCYHYVILFPTKSPLTGKSRFIPTSSINLSQTSSVLQVFFFCERIWTTQNLAHFSNQSETIMHTCQDLSRTVCECPQHRAWNKGYAQQCWCF